MQKKRPISPLAQLYFIALIGAICVMGTPAWALGLGAGPQSVPLGQPLDLSINVRLDAGETLGAECVQAEVSVGEQRTLPATVSTRPGATGDSAVIRINTSVAIDEPVLTVLLHAGCGARVSRRYVAFADPGVATPLAPPAAAVALPLAEALLERTPAPDASVATPAAVASGAATPAALTPRAALPPAPATAHASPSRNGGALRTRGEVRAERLAARRANAVAKAARNTLSGTLPKQATALPLRGDSTPRLRLEAADAAPPVPATGATAATTEIIEQAFEAVAQAASAARSAAVAASASAERMATLERELERTRSGARASQTEIERLRLLLNRPQLTQEWLWPLIAVVLVLGPLAAWMAWRMRAMQRLQEVAWARASAVAAAEVPVKATSPLPLINTPPPQSPAWADAATANSTTSATTPESTAIRPAGLRPEAATDNAMARTAVLPPSARVEETSPRDVSIEELIDIDQQAEFFIALGQDSAAIDMLVAHLRNTGGGSPLTYLKLLEIYRRVDDQAAYERTRIRFNQRYNAYAPEWGADLAHGKALEDYDAVVPRLTQAWPRPLDAMAELEALLFRKSRGELFELPAYRDVLFLYALARDLMDREPSDAGQVDLLLPLDAASRGAAVVGNSRAVSDVTDDDQPTSPLDLDLTPPPRTHESIFGEPLQPSPGINRSGDSRY